MFKKQLDLTPQLRMEIAELSHNSRIYLVPGKDDWFAEEVDISRFVQGVDISANVGDATTATVRMIKISADVDSLIDGVVLSELRLTRFRRLRRWWHHHGFRLRTKLVETTFFSAKTRQYARG